MTDSPQSSAGPHDGGPPLSEGPDPNSPDPNSPDPNSLDSNSLDPNSPRLLTAQDLGSSLLPRVGVGVDVHPFGDGDRVLALAGLSWAGERALAGHSDGDVAAHAACDALFSAAGVGDLGTHFGTERPELAGAAGVALLAQAALIVSQAGYVIGNIAIQIIGNSPKLAPRREEAQAVLSAVVAAPVSISATTTDGLGLTGRGEGIAAIATAILFPQP